MGLQLIFRSFFFSLSNHPASKGSNVRLVMFKWFKTSISPPLSLISLYFSFFLALSLSLSLSLSLQYYPSKQLTSFFCVFVSRDVSWQFSSACRLQRSVHPLIKLCPEGLVGCVCVWDLFGSVQKIWCRALIKLRLKSDRPLSSGSFKSWALHDKLHCHWHKWHSTFFPCKLAKAKTQVREAFLVLLRGNFVAAGVVEEFNLRCGVSSLV